MDRWAVVVSLLPASSSMSSAPQARYELWAGSSHSEGCCRGRDLRLLDPKGNLDFILEMGEGVLESSEPLTSDL